ncbi:hypothetical protein JAAARDRAFT_62157 [Jaapia argillacea MUCL 33604]|uniref:DUF6589 domain-containing protein n=1 Tax=Jaapia argillacea MUCL 33604 TaxID=933084 RepID=A0A067PLW2_9AGAM|nr:hypothetical protein JAAARDRAFT_62157 [Jaapia argillacea MUCL 33604]
MFTPPPVSRPSGPSNGQPQTTILQPLTSLLGDLPSSSDHEWSSPVVGSPSQKAACRQQKATITQLNTMARQEAAEVARVQAIALQEAEGQQQAAQQVEELAEKTKRDGCEEALQCLVDFRLSIRDLILYVSDPKYQQRELRWFGFFIRKGDVEQVLDWWISSENSATGWRIVKDWAVKYVCSVVNQEAQKITASGDLQTQNKPIDAASFLDNDLSRIYKYLCEKASVVMTIAKSFATTSRQIMEGTPARMLRKERSIAAALVQLLSEHSQSNNTLKKINAVYFYASGAQRQAIAVLSHLGITEAYSTLTTKGTLTPQRAIPTQPPSIPATSKTKALAKPGTLHRLSASMQDMAWSVAATGLNGHVYDNINMMFRSAEQVIGCHDSQENGTCATIWPLWKASIEHMKTVDLTKSFNRAPPLSLKDVILTPDENNFFCKCQEHTILRIIITHGGEKFKKFAKDLDKSQPKSLDKIEVHKTPLHPLPAMDIEEATILGNSKVVQAIFDELGVDTSPGQEGGYPGFGWGIWMPGLFHAKIANMHGFVVTHWGRQNVSNPGSLVFHNTCLNRLPITLTSLPPFCTCRDLVFVSLYSRILHCLLLVSKKDSLDDYAQSATWETLVNNAQAILAKYSSTQVISDLREARRRNGPVGNGDMIFENAFTDAVKSGDLGRVFLVLKAWALQFHGTGRTKYAHEMLHLLHNLQHVWPKPLRDIIMNNWLLNPTGKPNSFVEVDLVQEHLNYWIKVFYKAHGSAASWEWAGMIAPCITLLRDLAHKMHALLGDDQGTKHEPMDLTRDIPILMISLKDHAVYVKKDGQTFEDPLDKPVVDAMTSGIESLVNGNTSPLLEYNKSFQYLQARRHMKPLIGSSYLPEPDETTAVASSAPPPSLLVPHSGLNGVSTQPAVATESQPPGVEPVLSRDDPEYQSKGQGEGQGEGQDEGPFEDTLTRADEGDVSFEMDSDMGLGDSWVGLHVDANDDSDDEPI